MPLEDRDPSSLSDMQRYAESALAVVSTYGRPGEDDDDVIVEAALERYLEIVGEAAGRVSMGFRVEHSAIPWREIIAFRNVLIHQYDSVDPDTLWLVATDRIPELLTTLRPLVEEALGRGASDA